MKIHIGLDDTDSPRMGCTTYVAALLAEKIHQLGVAFIDFPNLIRLNPNVPWKTRGNGALCLRIACEENLFEEIEKLVIETVEANADFENDGTDPGSVLWFNEVPKEVKIFSQKAIQGLVTLDEAMSLITRFNAKTIRYKKARGIIGALAAIGEELKGDHTYEFIAYRTPENRGTKRKVDLASIIKMNSETQGLTFNNLDQEKNRALITPRGPDPILYGIRGETAEAVKHASEIIVTSEPVEHWVIFRTNHGTDAHLQNVVSISEVKPFNPVVVKGRVMDRPHIIHGGHVIFAIKDETGKIDCAAYEPSGNLREFAKTLIIGDIVEVYGGVRPSSPTHPLTINMEKLRIVELTPSVALQNPLCPMCARRMKSMGKNQGFECDKCGYHGKNLQKTMIEVDRVIKPGLYVAPPRSQRHLTKPLSRYGLEKKNSFRHYDEIVPYGIFASS